VNFIVNHLNNPDTISYKKTANFRALDIEFYEVFEQPIARSMINNSQDTNHANKLSSKISLMV